MFFSLISFESVIFGAVVVLDEVAAKLTIRDTSIKGLRKD
jgi:hypothetical protein